MQEQDVSYAPIESLEFFEEEKELIDIAVTGDHTFFVSADGENWILTHNSEFPDIDTDVADRDLLIGLLKERFGDTNVVPVSNYNTFQLKSLIKDVSRFFGLDFQEVNSILTPLDREVRSKVLKQGDDKNLFELKLEDALEHSPRFKQFSEEHPEVFDSISVLLHENKALGKHAGGVIVEDDLPNNMPLILSKKEPQTPWVEGMHFKHLNELGFVKCDLLGLETLRIIQRCIELILQRHEGNAKPSFQDVKSWYDKRLHPDILDLNDQHVYEHVYAGGRWAGVFQVTQRGAQKFFERSSPKSVTDIAALTSIYRPGPLTAKVDDIYMKAKEDPSTAHYEHPLVKQVLEETYGCLSGDTVITTELGDIKLEDIVRLYPNGGCQLPSYNEEACEVELDELLAAISTGIKDTVIIETEGGAVELTNDHLVFTRRGWVEAGSLTNDDEILMLE